MSTLDWSKDTQAKGDRSGMLRIFSRAEINGHRTDGRAIDRSIDRTIDRDDCDAYAERPSFATHCRRERRQKDLFVCRVNVVFAELLCTRCFTMSADTYHLREATGACRDRDEYNSKVLNEYYQSLGRDKETTTTSSLRKDAQTFISETNF